MLRTRHKSLTQTLETLVGLVEQTAADGLVKNFSARITWNPCQQRQASFLFAFPEFVEVDVLVSSLRFRF